MTAKLGLKSPWIRGTCLAAAFPLWAGVAAAQPAPQTSMDDLPTLSNRVDGGSVRCPDGSTRTYTGEAPNDLATSMLCDVPADVAEARRAQAQSAVDAKTAEAEQRAALSGQSGVAAGLEATAKTGRLDYFLGQTWVWIVGVVLAILGLSAVFGRFRR